MLQESVSEYVRHWILVFQLALEGGYSLRGVFRDRYAALDALDPVILAMMRDDEAYGFVRVVFCRRVGGPMVVKAKDAGSYNDC